MVFGSGVHCPDCGHGDVVRPTQGAAMACARARSRGMRIRKRGAGGEQPPKSKAAAAVPRRPRPGGGQPGRDSDEPRIPTTASRTAQLRITSSQVPVICPSWLPARGLEAACEMPRMRQGAPAPPCLLAPGSTGQASQGRRGRRAACAPRLSHARPCGLLGGGSGLRGHAGGQLLADPAAWPRRPRLCAEAAVRGGGASRRYSYMPISPRHAR